MYLMSRVIIAVVVHDKQSMIVMETKKKLRYVMTGGIVILEESFNARVQNVLRFAVETAQLSKVKFLRRARVSENEKTQTAPQVG